MDVELKQNEEDAGKLADLGNAGWGAGPSTALSWHCSVTYL